MTMADGGYATPTFHPIEGLTHFGLVFPYHTDLPRSKERLLAAFRAEAGSFFDALGLTTTVTRLPAGWSDPCSRSKLRVSVGVSYKAGAMISFAPCRDLLRIWNYERIFGVLHYAMRVRNDLIVETLKRLKAANYKATSSRSAGPSHKSWYVMGPWGYVFELQTLNGPH